MTNYQEEGIKYHPKILFTDGIDAIVKSLPAPYKVEMFNDENELRFDSRIRALVPFCKNSWTIYVEDSKATGHIMYGLIKNMASIKDVSIDDLVFSPGPIQEKLGTRISAVLCHAYTRWTVTMRSVSGNTLNTNFALDVMNYSNMDNEVTQLVDAAFSSLKTTVKKLAELKNMFRNIFKNVLQDLGGTICVVVDKDYVDNGFMGDGIWLTEPVSFSKLFLQTNAYNEQKLIAISGLLLSMLNKDGITVIDNTGQIRAFNVFVEANSKEVGNIIGGARKRAAYTVINSHRKDIVGVYFQSYDGELFYANVKR